MGIHQMPISATPSRNRKTETCSIRRRMTAAAAVSAGRSGRIARMILAQPRAPGFVVRAETPTHSDRYGKMIWPPPVSESGTGPA